MSILSHSEKLGNFGISLHSRIIESLVSQIESAIEIGAIRSEYDWDARVNYFSIYDFIREILKISGERKAYKRLTERDSALVAFCHFISFEQESGRVSRPSPATDMVGLLYMAYMVNCDFSYNLRASSAALIAADRRPEMKLQNATSSSKLRDLTTAPIADVDHTVTDPHSVKFSRTLTELHQVSGIKYRQYVAAAVKRDYELGIDYVESDGELMITEDVFNWLIVSFRSQRGTDADKLPDNIPLKRRGFRVRLNTKNARLSSAISSQAGDVQPQTKRSPGVSPQSLANLIPQPNKFGDGIKTAPIRVPDFLVDEVRQFVTNKLTQTD